jgi:RHS repeat-associated protein
LTSLTNPFGEVATFQYDANSRLIRKNLANGTYTTYSYNSRGFLTGIYNYKSDGTLLTYATYTYDAVGNRLSMSTPEGNYTYSYDAIYRLTGEVNPIGGTYSYTYDAVGNRLSMTHNGQTINYVYDAGNKLLQAGNTTFTYDGNGNMVSKTENGQTTTYVYNYEDKMIQVNLPNGSIVYSYDHSGKRIAKTAGGVTIDYYFDGDDLITEAQGANILAYYTQGQGLLSQRRNNASYFYHYDGLGSTKALTDANQNIQNTTKYDAWGSILQSSGTITNPYLYVGELGYYGDADAGMYLLTQRWYNPVVGRFVVRDPLKPPNQVNFFHYVSDNPIEYTDPSGMTIAPLPSYSSICIPYFVWHHTRFHGTVCRQWKLVTAFTVEGGGKGAVTVCIWQVTEESHGKSEKWWTIKYICYDRCHKYWYTLTRETKHHFQTVDEKGTWTIQKTISPVVSPDEEKWCIVYGPPGPPSGCFYSP